MPNPLVISGAAKAGQTILGAIGSGKRKKRRRRALERERKRLEGIRGTNVIEPFDIQTQSLASIRGRSEKLGGKIDKSLGLDIGQGQGALFGEELKAARETLASNIKQNQLLKTQRDENIDRRLFDIELAEDEGGGALETVGNLIGIAGQVGSGLAAESQARTAAEEAAQTARDIAPKGVGGQLLPTPGQGDFQPTEAITDASGIPILSGQNVFERQAGVEAATGESPLGGLQPAPKSLEDIAIIEVQKGNISLEEAFNIKRGLPPGGKTPKAKTDFASQSFEDLSDIQQSFQKNLGSFIKATPFQPTAGGEGRPTTAQDFITQTGTKQPDLKSIFDATMADPINRQFGAGAADSVFNQIARDLGIQQEFGVGEPPANDGSFTPAEYQEFIRQWIAAGAKK